MDALVGDLLAAARIDFEAISPRARRRRRGRRALEIARLPTDTLVVHGRPGPCAPIPTLLAARARGAPRQREALRRADDPAPRPRPRRSACGSRSTTTGPGSRPASRAGVRAVLARRVRGRRRPSRAGEGLGLALVRQIAEAHGGEAGARRARAAARACGSRSREVSQVAAMPGLDETARSSRSASPCSRSPIGARSRRTPPASCSSIGIAGRGPRARRAHAPPRRSRAARSAAPRVDRRPRRRSGHHHGGHGRHRAATTRRRCSRRSRRSSSPGSASSSAG